MRPALTRQVIVDAARQMIIDEGLASLSLRQIAATLDVTAPALYAYLADKGDLLRAVAEDELAALITRFEEVDDADAVDRVRAYFRAYVDHARANPELYPVMFLFPPVVDPATTIGREIPMATTAFTLPSEAVTEAVGSGAFAEIDPVQASLVLFTAAHGTASVLLMGFGFDTATEDLLVDTAIDTVVTGLSRR